MSSLNNDWFVTSLTFHWRRIRPLTLLLFFNFFSAFPYLYQSLGVQVILILRMDRNIKSLQHINLISLSLITKLSNLDPLPDFSPLITFASNNFLESVRVSVLATHCMWSSSCSYWFYGFFIIIFIIICFLDLFTRS